MSSKSTIKVIIKSCNVKVPAFDGMINPCNLKYQVECSIDYPKELIEVLHERGYLKHFWFCEFIVDNNDILIKKDNELFRISIKKY